MAIDKTDFRFRKCVTVVNSVTGVNKCITWINKSGVNKWDCYHRGIVKDNRTGWWFGILSSQDNVEQIDIQDHPYDRISSTLPPGTRNTSTQPAWPPQNSASTAVGSTPDRCIQMDMLMADTRPDSGQHLGRRRTRRIQCMDRSIRRIQGDSERVYLIVTTKMNLETW